MRFLRSFTFYIFFYTGTIFYFLFFSPVRFFTRNFVVILSTFWTKSVIKLSKLILGIKYEIEGYENIPKSGSFVVASNHQSAWETFFLGSLFPGSIFVLKYELKKIPIFSQYFKKLGFIFVKRDKAFDSLKILLKSVKKLISKNNCIFVIFPEGTRIKPGERIKLNSGVFAIHKFANLPILPIKLNSGKYWINKKFNKREGKIIVKILPLICKEDNKQKVMTKLENYYYH